MKTYTYEAYLEQWHDHYADADSGIFIYWQYGRQKEIRLPRMTREQFLATLARYDNLALIIDGLQRRPDYGCNDELDYEVNRLLRESFNCELPLFM